MASSSSSASQAGPSDAHYPSWPHIDDAAEYWEIPPDHFLAQQGAAAKGRSASPEASTSTSVLSSSPSDYDHHHHHHEPLAELASALPDGIASFALQGPGPVPVPAHGEEGDMPDTSTLAAADFDIDVRSGFLPPEAPVSRLEGVEGEWWETALEQAHRIGLKQGGGGPAITQTERRAARRWRRAIREVSS